MTNESRFTAQSEAAESLLGRLADELVAARNRGEPQDVEQLAAQYPEIADVIRQTFPAMLLLREPHIANSTSTELLHGDELGDFRLIRELGRGGMGVVYEALQRSLGRRVALKVLPLAGMLDERRLRRFQNEAHAAAALQHPHIVPVYGVGCERGVHYYAMQLIQGVSLAEVVVQLRISDRGLRIEASCNITSNQSAIRNSQSEIATRPHAALSTLKTERPGEYFRTVARLGIQAAEALAYAHREGVIHRDIKPSNLLIDESGKLWIADFGLARVHAGGELTLSGDLLGTLRYMSPEQLTDNKVVDQRTDVYSLGLTLYEMLVGGVAFADVPRELLAQKILSEDPRPPRSADASIPLDLETIILRATAKDRDARYQSAEDLAAELTRFLDCKPILARRPTRVQRLRYWGRRNRALATTLGLLLVTMSVLSVGGPLMAWRQAAMAREYRRQLDIADLNVAYQAWYEGNVNQVEDVLRRHTPEQDSADQRSFAWRYLRALYERSQSNIIARHQGAVSSVAVSPDGKTVASAGRDRRIVLTDLERGGEARGWLAHDGEVTDLAYGQAGLWLVSGSEDGVAKLWDVTGEPTCLVTLQCSAFVRSLAVTPDGECVITGTKSGMLLAWSSGGEHRWSIPAHKEQILDVSIAPNGELFATASADNSLQIRRTDTGELVRTIDDFWGNAFCVAFSLAGDKLIAGTAHGTRVWDVHTGRQLAGFDALTQVAAAIAIARNGLIATGAHNRQIAFWDDLSGRRLAEYTGNRETVSSVAFTPDGHKLVSGDEDGTVRIYDARGAQRRRERWHQLKSAEWWTNLALSPNGSTLVSSTLRGWPGDPDMPKGEMNFWDMAAGTPRVTQAVTTRDAHHIAVSPDGKSVASCGLGEVRLWDAASGQRRELLHDEPQHCLLSVAFSPDGRWLATGGRDSPQEGKGHGLVILWDLADEPPRRVDLPLKKSDWQPQNLCFASDSRHLAVAGDRSWRDCSVDLWAFNERGWQLKRENMIRTNGRNSWISFLPARNQLVVTTWSGETVVQDIAEDKPRLNFRGHSRSVFSFALTADGSLLATGGYPKITLWDAVTGDQLGALTMPTWVSNLAFTPDGNTLIWAGGDGSVNFERATELRTDIE